MISTRKVLCFVAIAFADSDFQTDHDAVMRELSEGENQGLDTIEEQRELADAIEEFRELVGDTEEFRELVGDTDEFRELADAIADGDREVFFRKWIAAKKTKKCKKKCADFWEPHTKRCTTDRHGRGRKKYVQRCKANAAYGWANCNKKCSRQLDEDEEVSAAVLV